MTTLDYAQVYETHYRPGRRIRRIAAYWVWVMLFACRPGLAMEIWRARGK